MAESKAWFTMLALWNMYALKSKIFAFSTFSSTMTLTVDSLVERAEIEREGEEEINFEVSIFGETESVVVVAPSGVLHQWGRRRGSTVWTSTTT